MKLPEFKQLREKTDTGLAQETRFMCPKCEGFDVSIMFVHATDRLLLICRRCGYQQSREPLDREEE